MEIDLETGSNGEGGSPEPIFHSIISAMGSKKEATADQIHRRIQRDGATNYSKPQVDRALANALQYGIFEVRNNRYRVRDDVLDDEDTIYWQAHIKREKTPYRLENSQKDYINPEKDQHTFRRLHVSDGEGCTSCRKQTAALRVAKNKKERVYNQKTVNVNLKNVKENGDQNTVQKSISDKTRKVKRQRIQARKGPAKVVVRNAGPRDAKKRKKELSCDISEYKYNPHSHHTQESDSDASSKAIKRKKRKSKRNVNNSDEGVEDEDDDEEEEDDDEEEEDYDEEEDEDEGDEEEEDEEEDEEDEDEDQDQDQDEDEDEDDEYEDDEDESAATIQDNCLLHSSYFEYLKEPYASKFQSQLCSTHPCYGDVNRAANESYSNHLPNDKNRENWNMGCRQIENLRVCTRSTKVDWLMNRPENTEDGTVKQFDNALEIEPLDSLPFKNLEEPSYIS